MRICLRMRIVYVFLCLHRHVMPTTSVRVSQITTRSNVHAHVHMCICTCRIVLICSSLVCTCIRTCRHACTQADPEQPYRISILRILSTQIYNVCACMYTVYVRAHSPCTCVHAHCMCHVQRYTRRIRTHRFGPARVQQPLRTTRRKLHWREQHPSPPRCMSCALIPPSWSKSRYVLFALRYAVDFVVSALGLYV